MTLPKPRHQQQNTANYIMVKRINEERFFLSAYDFALLLITLPKSS